MAMGQRRAGRPYFFHKEKLIIIDSAESVANSLKGFITQKGFAGQSAKDGRGIEKTEEDSPTEKRPRIENKDAKVMGDSNVDIYTSDLNEIFLRVSKSLFPNASPKLTKLTQ